MKTSRHEESLDRQVQLIQWWKTIPGRQYAAGFMASVMDKPGMSTDEDDDRLGLFLAEQQIHALDRAPTYWVSKDMISVCEHAAKSMPGQPLHWEDMPTQSGFVFFDRSVYVIDARGKKVGFRGVMWCPAFVRTTNMPQGTEAINLVFYSDRDDPNDEDRIWADTEERLAATPKLILLHFTPWTLNEPWGEEDQRLIDGSVTDTRRFMAAFWTIIQQHIIASAPLPRALARRTARGKVTPVNEIKVVTLRKVIRRTHDDGEEHAENHVDWSHRWIVDGFWRNQWYPSIKTHRLIWISPYVKGPEDRPLIIKDKIYKFSR